MIHKYTTRELVAAKPSNEELGTLPRNPISIVLDNIRSLENVGLFFRLADAIRVEKLYLTGITGYPSLPPKKETRRPGIVERADHLISKTAIQTIPFVPWEYTRRPFDVVKKLKHNEIYIVALELCTTSILYTQARLKFPLALIIGHERKGISQRVLTEADQIIHLPMYGMGNSHNSSVACAIVSYYALRLCPTLVPPTLP